MKKIEEIDLNSDGTILETFECPECNGMMGIDSSYLEQRADIDCPYCKQNISVFELGAVGDETVYYTVHWLRYADRSGMDHLSGHKAVYLYVVHEGKIEMIGEEELENHQKTERELKAKYGDIKLEQL